MTDLNHSMWNSLVADLELQPLGRGVRSILDDLLCGDEFDDCSDSLPLRHRLVDLGLLEEGGYTICDCCGHEQEGGSWLASEFLKSIEARGLLDRVCPP